MPFYYITHFPYHILTLNKQEQVIKIYIQHHITIKGTFTSSKYAYKPKLYDLKHPIIKIT